MSVLGVGLDLVDIESFATQLEVPGSTFLSSTFTAGELAAANEVDARRGAPARIRHLAAHFGAKEAFIKAWSMTRLGRAPAMPSVTWHDIEIRDDAWGRPALRLGGRTSESLQRTLGAVTGTVSLSHDGPMAAAVVVLERVGYEQVPSRQGELFEGR